MSGVLKTAGKIAGVVAAGALIVSTAGIGGAALAGVAKIAAAAAAIPALPATLIPNRKPPHDRNHSLSRQSIRLHRDRWGRDERGDGGGVCGFASKAVMFEPVRIVMALTGRWVTLERFCDTLNRYAVPNDDPAELQRSILAAIVPAIEDLSREPAHPALERMRGCPQGSEWSRAFSISRSVARGFSRHIRPVASDRPVSRRRRRRRCRGLSQPPLTAADQDEVWPRGHIHLPRREARTALSLPAPRRRHSHGLGKRPRWAAPASSTAWGGTASTSTT